MVFRILQYLLNRNELVDKLAESNFMKKIARFVVHKIIRAKSLTEDMKSEQFNKTLKNIAEKLKEKKDKLDGKPRTMKDHSIIFVGSEPSKDKYVITRALSYFTMPANDLPKRILTSFTPPLHSRFVYVDFLGPCLAFILLAAILSYGHAYKIPSAVYHRSPTEVLAIYCFLMPAICYILTGLGKSSISFLQILSLLGYGLYGYVFTLIISFISDETNNVIFYFSMIFFTGSSVFRICLIILLTIKVPGARLLVCSIIATLQVLFVVFLYFTFVHSSFVFTKH
ncbi:Longin domain [Cinara cedri]|uniref:Longin domain n=1 Tax=Cinara cedri TaxID=506608 RepID=A0A5E4M3U5_9HEMI|nr:Longin domain [Cinara cedri]